VVEVVDCVRYERARANVWAEPLGWCLILRNARAFARPVPFPGALSLFQVPDDVLADVRLLPPEARPA
jgi:hypothetical protein